ncbi:MAG: glycosyltransferase family 2 protein [Candidatus Liptonbacteria bacterium]|nr:glycosyltransferase family 2 protein [Candidatus Liptonbacteria bacterium]
MASPKVTIIIATYNRTQYLGRAIESAQAQTLKDWEMIAVEDGSPDNTREVVAGYAARDPRVRCLSIPRAGRIAIVSNAALREARGEYIAILDDDDWWLDPKKLEKQAAFLNTHPDYVGCGGGIVTVNPEGKETGRVLKPETNERIRACALYANPMANLTTMFRRSAAEKVGRYDETMLQFADWDFWLKMGLEGKLYNFPEYFAAYRMWERGASFSKQREIRICTWRIIHRYRGTYPGFARAVAFAVSYSIYSCLPQGLKKVLNAPLSRLKKALFSN